MQIVEAHADGACLGNGRPEATAGIGVYFGERDPRNLSLPLYQGRQTNQRAELASVLAALLIFAQHDDHEAHERGYWREQEYPEQKLILYCDSNYAVQCVGPWADRWETRGWWNAKGEPVANSDLIKAIRMVVRERQEYAPEGALWKGEVEFVHVRGHIGNPGNYEADAFAVSGARKHGYKRLRNGHIIRAIREACDRATYDDDDD